MQHQVVFLTTKTELWCKNTTTMTKQERFERLCSRLLSAPATYLPDFDFSSLCRQEGLSITTAENLFYSHFGLSIESFLSRQQAG